MCDMVPGPAAYILITEAKVGGGRSSFSELQCQTLRCFAIAFASQTRMGPMYPCPIGCCESRVLMLVLLVLGYKAYSLLIHT